jgi:hypothetical protein
MLLGNASRPVNAGVMPLNLAAGHISSEGENNHGKNDDVFIQWQFNFC